MKKVVYFIGAGFSAPLGIPVMNDFYLKGRDLYFKNRERFEYFIDVIEDIENLSKVKNFFESDLYNIEEILSLLEMGIEMGGKNFKAKRTNFVKFISDVVDYFTPEIDTIKKKDPGLFEGEVYSKIFGIKDENKRYSSFVAGLFPITFTTKELNGIFDANTLNFSISKNPEACYSFITLNYDRVIENSIDFINNACPRSMKLKYLRNSSSSESSGNNSIFLLKLHGSIEDKSIIPPTYNKNLQSEELTRAWQKAYQLLSEAEEIRIIGYSLPETDNNIRYLLKCSILESKNLKSLDVLCLDKNGEVKKKYDKFVKFKYYNFYNCDVKDYLEKIKNQNRLKTVDTGKEYRIHYIDCDVLEKCHKKFTYNFLKM